MRNRFLSRRRACVALVAAAVAFGPAAIAADMAKNSAATLNSDGQKTLNSLYAKVPAAKTIGGKATAVLVFPKVTKAGLGIGGQYGEGVLLKGGKPVAYYNTAGVSTGLQAGAQTFGYAMFFMNDAALKALDKTEGFEVGVGPSVVLVDEGMAKTTTTTTLDKDVYAFIFGQKGLMAGLGIQGNKITKIHPK
jgi:lipid-binding SYLF domain-containing protein